MNIKIDYPPNIMFCFTYNKVSWIAITSNDNEVKATRFDKLGEDNKIDLSNKTKVEKELIYKILN